MKIARLVYLHGFASGPGSVKANVLASRFRDQGLALEIPDPTADGFRHSPISR